MTTDSSSANRLIEIGIALSAEKDTTVLMERILLEAMDISQADGGTLYLRDEDFLKFEIVRTNSLEIAQGGTTGGDVTLPPMALKNAEGAPNTHNIVTYAANEGKTVNIPDVYLSDDFDFTGTKKFDEAFGFKGFRSTSFLTVPMKNNADEVIGVLQLLNRTDPETKVVGPFDGEIQPIIEALASQAAVALDNATLLKEMTDLQQAFIQLLANALDAKSPYTGGHCQRVPELAQMLTEAANAETTGIFKDFNLSEEDRYELYVASWMHDCGKVVTPEYVVDKSTKLETITDRIHEVRVRFEVLKRDAEIDCLKAIVAGGDAPALQAALTERLAEIDADYYFIAATNVGGEFLDDDAKARVKAIAAQSWTRTLNNRVGISIEERKRFERTPAPELPVVEPLLMDREDHLISYEVQPFSADPDNPYGFKVDVPEYKFNKGEVYNLSISRGTLTNEERFIINDHIVQTAVMLENLPLPKALRRVPEIACGHHEKIDGTGYPRKLTGDQMSVQARVMAIADVFEALTAADRPYKDRKTLSQSLRIMSFMVKDNHLDRGLYDLFLDSGVYQDYAEKFLLADQIDEVDVEQFRAA
ncbi:MAG: GAF domain-containing protein [Gammaproteobacteria bacterium]|jgi:HD-GYP domain-containing protein (c-di-GMP phosphodiesterase class II)|nr:GAF domain-containing protein [Gammaproteobacteria bacterium]